LILSLLYSTQYMLGMIVMKVLRKKMMSPSERKTDCWCGFGHDVVTMKSCVYCFGSKYIVISYSCSSSDCSSDSYKNIFMSNFYNYTCFNMNCPYCQSLSVVNEEKINIFGKIYKFNVLYYPTFRNFDFAKNRIIINHRNLIIRSIRTFELEHQLT
jgi:hypothetical protein